MNSWVVKIRNGNEGPKFLEIGAREWVWTKRPPAAIAAGDPIFFWRAAPEVRIVGTGKVVGPIKRMPRGERSRIRVEYTSGELIDGPDILRLRRNRSLSSATFLQSGPSMTFYALTPDEGKALAAILRQPTAGDVSRRNRASEDEVLDLDLMNASDTEGTKRLVRHLRSERSRKLVRLKKLSILKSGRSLACEACGTKFEKLSAEFGEGCCEVHHAKPISRNAKGTRTRLADLHVLCSNCHRMLHRTNPIMSVEQFRARVLRAGKRSSTT